jgi:hypothetical protein
MGPWSMLGLLNMPAALGVKGDSLAFATGIAALFLLLTGARYKAEVALAFALSNLLTTSEAVRSWKPYWQGEEPLSGDPLPGCLTVLWGCLKPTGLAANFDPVNQTIPSRSLV